MYLGRVADKDDVGQGVSDDAVGGIERVRGSVPSGSTMRRRCVRALLVSFSNSVMMTYVCFGLNGFAFAMLLQRYEFSSV